MFSFIFLSYLISVIRKAYPVDHIEKKHLTSVTATISPMISLSDIEMPISICLVQARHVIKHSSGMLLKL